MTTKNRGFQTDHEPARKKPKKLKQKPASGFAGKKGKSEKRKRIGE